VDTVYHSVTAVAESSALLQCDAEEDST